MIDHPGGFVGAALRSGRPYVAEHRDVRERRAAIRTVLLPAMRAIGTLFLVTTLAVATSVATAQTPTAEQLRQLQQLTPAQREALLEALGESTATQQQAPLTEPVVVTPRVPDERSTLVPDPDSALVMGEIPQPLKHFGYDLFAGVPTTFAPATDIPIPVNYIIGPGDTVELQLFGSENALYSLVVTREGILNIPELGPVSVAGLRFRELKDTLELRVAEQMIGVKASITMGRLRSIRVFVLGDAYRPGSYTVSALSTMTNALFVSGGINLIGSLRKIQLKRRGRVVTTLDLYDLLLKGDTSGDARLQPGDVLFVPPVGPTVGVDGEVRRPAIYELRREKSVSQVLELAGGLLPTAFPEASRIERINASRERTVIDVDLSTRDGLQSAVQPDDLIHIYSVLEKREDIVLLSGHVYRAGLVQWQPGMRLTQLISSIDELQPKADANYVLIRREIPENLSIRAFSADLIAALAAPGSSADVLLAPRDQVTVFSFEQNRQTVIRPILEELRLQAGRDESEQIVVVNGRVRAPGAYPLEAGMRVSDLIRAGGQLSEAAYPVDAELIRYTTGVSEVRETELIDIDLAAILAGNTSADLALAPHDVLSIKEIPHWRDLESVSLEGEVRFPGRYPIRRGERLRSVIQRAGGLTDTAFADGAIFLRQALRQREQEQLQELTERLQSEISVAELSADSDMEDAAARQALLQQLESAQATGRLVIDLPRILAAQYDQEADLVLATGDRLLVPEYSQTVTIVGEVQFPTSHVYDQGISRNEYISKSGGTTQNADKKRIYIVRADGEVIASSGSRFFRGRNVKDIRPGDTIVVPLDADRINRLTLWTNVSTIIFNIGIAAAAAASF